jgi:signal peptidase I
VTDVRTASSWRRGWPALLAGTAARFVLATVVVLVAVSVVPRIAGWQTSVVMSGSMSPTLEQGDVVVVRPVAAARLTPGRIVLVDDPDAPGELRLHRIAAIEHGELRLRGDANPRDDSSLVAPAAVHGVGTLRLPFLGLPVVWAAGGDVVPLVLTGAALAALVALALLHRGRDDDELPRPEHVGRRACTPFRLRRPRRRMPGAARVLALAGVAVVLAGLPGAAPARAVFSSISGNPSSSLTAGTYFSCAAATGAAGATQYYPLQETAGPTAVNKGTAGTAANATYSSTGISYGITPGPRCAVGQQSAIWLDGASGAIAAANAVTNPTTFTEQLWFATYTTSGGKLMGFGSSTTGASSSYDRHIYMLNSGQLSFGVYDGSATHVVTSTAAYNDSVWHLATASFSTTAGMTLYVDGVQVGRDATSKTAQNFTGYWRIGYDSLGNWPSAPTSSYFQGAVAHAAVFPTVLSAAEVAAQYGAGPWTCAAAAGSNGSAAAVYLPLAEASGTTAANAGSTGAVDNGTYAATGVSHPVGGPNCGTNVLAATQLDGSTGQVWTTRAWTNPQWFSVQIWFSTTTTTGGKLIGFGLAAGGAQSSSYDRHIFMSDNGTLTFGLYNGGYYTATSPAAYNDGAWHLATATFSPGTGMRLYVDGAQVASNTQTTAAENYTGYWRIGYDNLGGWPGAPSNFHFTGRIAQASVYDRVLTTDEIAGQYLAGR